MSEHALIARPTWFCKSCWREKILMMNLKSNSSRDARVRAAGSLPALACVSLTLHEYLSLSLALALALALSFLSFSLSLLAQDPTPIRLESRLLRSFR
jgi:hypothetical protein